MHCGPPTGGKFERVAFNKMPEDLATRKRLSGNYEGVSQIQRRLGRPADAVKTVLERKACGQ